MLEIIFGYLDAITLCLFGVFVSASTCGISLNKNILYLMLFTAVLLIGQLFFLLVLDAEIVRKIYPFIVHIPLVILLVRVFRLRVIPAIFSVITAFMLCEPSKWCALLMYSVYEETWFYYSSKVVFTIIFGAFLIRHLSPGLAVIVSQPTRTVVLFAILPFIYYLFDYSFIVYTDIFYTDHRLVHEFLPLVLSTTYLVLCSLFFKENMEKTDLEHQHQIIQIQLLQSQREVEMIQHSEYEMTLLRHDMRHFLSNIQVHIENGNYSTALDCIRTTINTINNVAVIRFCSNDLVNAVVSYFASEMKSRRIQFDYSIQIEKELTCKCPEIYFTSILSNALENAIHAAEKMPVDERLIVLKLHSEDDRLLLLIKNSALPDTLENFNEKSIKDFRASAKPPEEKHGLGTQSIRYLCERLGGNCHFSIEDGMFVLKVIL